MIRQVLLHLSRSGRAAHLAETFPGIRAFARRFVAGRTLADVAPAVRRLNEKRFAATVSFLGENVAIAAEADAARDEYLRLVVALADNGLDAGVSVKLTQLGLRLDYDTCRERLAQVVSAAADRGLFVRIDMEHSPVVDSTLSMYHEVRSVGFQRLGVAIQSYLRRSRADMEALVREGASIRLVKGAYLEPPSVAFPEKKDVDAGYRHLLDVFRQQRADASTLAVATHDQKMIEYALASFGRDGVPPDRYEFQMIYGIRGDLQRQLRDGGRRVRIYVPYGSNWYPYLVRRLAERPANLFFFLRNVARR